MREERKERRVEEGRGEARKDNKARRGGDRRRSSKNGREAMRVVERDCKVNDFSSDVFLLESISPMSLAWTF